MLCEICGKNEATFHYSEVVNGKKTEHHLCNECAANTDISYYSSLFDNDGRLGQLLSGLLGNAFILGDTKEDPKQHIICPRCGMSYGEFIKNSIFGCNECYDVFGPLLDDSIKKIQGSVNHAGKKPKQAIYSSKDNVTEMFSDENAGNYEGLNEASALNGPNKTSVSSGTDSSNGTSTLGETNISGGTNTSNISNIPNVLTGDSTINKAKLKQEADILSKRLKVAIVEEDFEEAARLRDKIKEIKALL